MFTRRERRRGGSAGSRQRRTMLALMAMDVGGMLPVCLSGALAVHILQAFAMTPGELALLISSFFLTGSVTAMLVGAEIDHLGPRRAAGVGCVVSIGALGAVALAPTSRWSLTVALMVSGAALSVTMPATNAIVTREIATSRRAIAISAKQSAVPVALLVSGVALPTMAPSVGWRWAFMAAIAFPLFGLLTLPRASLSTTTTVRPPRALGWSTQRQVLRVGFSVLLASLLPGALTAFLALTLIESGMSAVLAASLLVTGNCLGIVVRVTSGYWADRSESDGNGLVAALMLAGAVGAVLLTTEVHIAAGMGSLLALGLGWGWTGLTHYMVVRTRPANAGAASAVVQSGGMLGSATGPLIMGAAVPLVGMDGAWIVVATLTALASALIAFAPRPVPEVADTAAV